MKDLTLEKEINIPYNFLPRDYQVPLFNSIMDGNKRAVAIWHRRAGKDKTIWNLMIRQSLRRVGAYYYFLPTYNQGNKIIWNGMDKAGFPFLSHIPKELRTQTLQQNMMVRLYNGSIIQIIGSDNIDSIVGTNPVGCVFSEYSLQDPRGWDFIRPILRENGGWALFNFTPRGHNHAYELWKMAEGNPTWFCQRLTIEDTGVLTPDDIDAERADGMSEDLIQQEYYCSFDAAIQGAYFAKQLQDARSGKRVCSFDYDPALPVSTFWDLGMSDTMPIWFAQSVGNEIRLIDYYENSGEGLEHYAGILQEKGYRYSRHCAPHDIEVRELGTGQSRKEVAYELGINFTTIPRVSKKMDSIEAVRRIFPRCWFNIDKCQRGIDALSSYRKDYDDKNQTFREKPVHDWASHAADAFQTLAMAHDHDPSAFGRDAISEAAL